jgi:hypothetical protein
MGVFKKMSSWNSIRQKIRGSASSLAEDSPQPTKSPFGLELVFYQSTGSRRGRFDFTLTYMSSASNITKVFAYGVAQIL